MLETCVLALLSALGIVLLFWCAAGFWMLPCAGEGYCVLYATDAADSLRQIRSYRYLTNSGMIRIPMFVVDCGMQQEDKTLLLQEMDRHPQLRLYSLQQWEDFIETERKERVSRT